MILKIFKYTFLLLFSSWVLTARAQQDSTQQVKGIQYASRAAAAAALQKAPKWAGLSVSVDAAGLLLAGVSAYGQIEGALRLNFYHKYFPVVEVGWGVSDHTDGTTDMRFKVNAAPYIRLGCDYNFARDWRSGNRVFGGVRLAYTTFDYDLEGSGVIDPVWGGHTPFTFSNVASNAFWGELVFGLEARIWKHFHIGWSARYRRRFHQKISVPGQSWYLPGYGKNDTHSWGGTFNLVFDI